MATHSSTLAWRIPWTEELGGLQSTGSQRVGHEEQLTFSLAEIYPQASTVVKNLPANARKHRRRGLDSWVGKMPWRSKWQPTPVFLPGKLQG